MRYGTKTAAVVACAALFALTACGTTTGGDSGDGSGGSAAGSVDVREFSASSLADIAKMRIALRRIRNTRVAECMADKGFPQLLEAQQNAVTRESVGDTSPIGIDPLDFGPYTEKQARRYGMLGSQFAMGIGGTRPLPVISKDPAFEAAQDACQQKFSNVLGADVGSLIARAGRLQETVLDQVKSLVQDETQSILYDRLSCVQKNGYPGIDPERASNAGSFRAWLKSVGIRPGVRSGRGTRPEVEKGEVVVAPPPERSYTPSTGEVEFALVYVECGKKINVVRRVRQMSKDALAKVLPEYEAEIVALGTKLKRAVREAAAE